MVIDHTSYAVSDTEGDHTLIASDDFIQSDVILGSTTIEVSCVTRLFVDCNVCWKLCACILLLCHKKLSRLLSWPIEAYF